MVKICHKLRKFKNRWLILINFSFMEILLIFAINEDRISKLLGWEKKLRNKSYQQPYWFLLKMEKLKIYDPLLKRGQTKLFCFLVINFSFIWNFWQWWKGSDKIFITAERKIQKKLQINRSTKWIILLIHRMRMKADNHPRHSK